MLTSLDLFTGIGGFSHALSNVCKPIAYCDVHDLSKRALHDLMDRGLLPHAPIFHDVKEITPQTLEATCGVKTFDVLCAGFPCQDVSVMNIRGKGIDGERSGLIHEVLRIARACQPSLLFLENSPNLIHRGLDRISGPQENRLFRFPMGHIQRRGRRRSPCPPSLLHGGGASKPEIECRPSKMSFPLALALGASSQATKTKG